MSKSSGTLILGVGNPLRRDDGIGPKVIEMLTNIKSDDKFCEDTDLIDGGTDGLGLIEYFKKYKKIILIDAVEMGMVAGTIKVFTPDQAAIHLKKDSLSTHGFGIPELLKMAQELGMLPELTIVGVQPESTDYGMGLSPKVSNTLAELIDLVNKISLDKHHKVHHRSARDVSPAGKG